VTGFVRGQGIVQNASIHVGARFLLNVDIKDFFPSIRTEQVLKIFRKLGFPAEMSRVLSMLCTYEGSLPQGAPTSPYLANLVFREIDDQIIRMCKHHDLTYSRYADDLTFSSGQPISQNILAKLDTLLRSGGFKLNPKKIRFAKSGQAMYVTGLVVNEKVQPDRRTRRLLRAMFHRASTHPLDFRKKSAHLSGWASYVYAYNRILGSEYLKIARSVASK
jgi:RNA-directed DNA polymerase